MNKDVILPLVKFKILLIKDKDWRLLQSKKIIPFENLCRRLKSCKIHEYSEFVRRYSNMLDGED